jgi:hypothetical protein
MDGGDIAVMQNILKRAGWVEERQRFLLLQWQEKKTLNPEINGYIKQVLEQTLNLNQKEI